MLYFICYLLSNVLSLQKEYDQINFHVEQTEPASFSLPIAAGVGIN